MQVTTDATQKQVQENLLWALEQDQQQFLHYLDSLLKDAEGRIDTTPGLTLRSPTRDSNEQSDLQISKPGDNVGVYGVLTVGVAIRDGESLSGDFDYNSDTVSSIQDAVQVAPDELLMNNPKLHPPSSTQDSTVHCATKDLESLIIGKHEKVKIIGRLILCCQLRLTLHHLT